ncbi:hypothetical protein NW762_012015 [Fusarium torreyae]|uniref:NAD(P)-binding domain-containing protein n=1 Tax=Fusarium torreyae TaxID=1237075 RepID=A0A9W8RSL5_9HYPO|nr:hypothetical protein NW762_012015 [Fusarium torreyae]
MSQSTSLKVGVIGPAGFGGSYLCVELINRGHRVVGLSRNPQKLGSHALYESRSINVDTQSEVELAKAFSDVDVLVCEYGPHTAGHEALKYMPFVEVIRKIILAVKRAKVGYFVMLGGTGSLHVPHEDGICVADSKDFFLAYRRGIADSHAHVTYMEERLGPLGSNLRAYRNARFAVRGNDEEKKTKAKGIIDEYEASIKQGDMAAEFIKAARTTVMFFCGNKSFDWTYVSPSALYRPGKRTGEYKITINDLPLKGEPQHENPLEGRLLGVSAADLAIAIADEVETRKHIYQHWSATSDLSDDTPAPADFFFKRCDVSVWAEVVEFFQHTYRRFGQIDAVISNAAINKVETIDEPSETGGTEALELQEPDVSVLKVNAIGTWYVSKCAIHFFRKNPETKSQLVLFGSVASFFDTPPLYTYCASKAAVLGLLRGLRTQTVKYNVSVNMIAPWMTLTDMITDHVRKVWGDLPANTPLDVAKASVLPVLRPDVNGKAFIINGGNITEVEDKLDETQGVWLGPDFDKYMREGQRRLIY